MTEAYTRLKEENAKLSAEVAQLRTKVERLTSALGPLVEATDIEAKVLRHQAKSMTSGAARVKLEYALALETKRNVGLIALKQEE